MKKEGDQGSRIVSMAVSSLLGGALAAAVVLALLFGCAAAISAGVLSETLELHVTIAACVIGSFCGGELTKRRWRCRSLIAGASAGAVLFLILLTVGLVVYRSADPTGGASVGILAACLCGGAVSGLLSAGGSKKKKKRSY